MTPVSFRVAALGLLSFVSACGGETWLSQGIVARREVLTDVAERVVVPSFERLRAEAEGLAAAAGAAASSPSLAHVEAARDAWRAARAAWGASEAYLIDPPFDPGRLAKIDTYPVDATRVEAVIAGGSAIDADLVEGLGSTVKGFFAVEYLLFAEPDDPAAVVAALADASTGEARRSYLAAAAAVLASDLSSAADQWDPAGRDLAGSLGRDENMSVERLANRLAVLTETIADRRLGGPLGKTSGGVPQPRSAQSERSGNTRQDILDALGGLRNVYFGRFGAERTAGLDELVSAASGELDDAYRAALSGAIEAVEAIPEPLTEAVESDRASVEAAYAASKALARRTATDLVSGLGTTLGFSPFDGD